MNTSENTRRTADINFKNKYVNGFQGSGITRLKFENIAFVYLKIL
jgi:hypothetical protein